MGQRPPVALRKTLCLYELRFSCLLRRSFLGGSRRHCAAERVFVRVSCGCIYLSVESWRTGVVPDFTCQACPSACDPALNILREYVRVCHARRRADEGLLLLSGITHVTGRRSLFSRLPLRCFVVTRKLLGRWLNGRSWEGTGIADWPAGQGYVGAVFRPSCRITLFEFLFVSWTTAVSACCIGLRGAPPAPPPHCMHVDNRFRFLRAIFETDC